MKNKKVILDVGANNGLTTFGLMQKFCPDDLEVYAIEPTYSLVSKYLYPLFKFDPRVKICNFGIDVENGFKRFNVNSTAGGVNSLYEFTDNIREVWDKKIFFHDETISAPFITLKTFCEIFNITQIDYLWVDTQGNDLNVLKSLGDKISIVKEGRIEVANKTSLYKDVDNTRESAEKWLHENGFSFEDAKYSSGQHEVDIDFKRTK